jgi:hypothetical protein
MTISDEDHSIEVKFKLEKEQVKTALKEALKEWLDDKVKAFGWLSLKTLGAAAFALLVWLLFVKGVWELRLK